PGPLQRRPDGVRRVAVLVGVADEDVAGPRTPRPSRRAIGADVGTAARPAGAVPAGVVVDNALALTPGNVPRSPGGHHRPLDAIGILPPGRDCTAILHGGGVVTRQTPPWAG